jgi:hypothetical protein
MANEKFSPEIEEILSTVFNCPPGQIAIIHYDYVSRRHWCPDAPEVDALTLSDVHGVYSIHNYDTVNQETWSEYLNRVTKVEEKREDSNDPFLPSWISKTEDRPTAWMHDSNEQLPAQFKEALTKVFKKCVPVSADVSGLNLIGLPPTFDTNTMSDIIGSLEFMSNFIVDSMGESMDDNNTMFRWSRSLCTLAGLGFTALRHFAERLAPIESDWSHWASCSDEDLRADVLEARKICCYPISLLRADYTDLQRICADAPVAPRWLKASLAVHLFKNVRYISNFNGKPTLWVCYKGEHSYLALAPEGVNQRLTEDANLSVKKSLCNILEIRQVTGRNRLDLDDLIGDVLSKTHPRDFPKQRDLKEVPHLIVPRAVRITPSHELHSEFRWINPGIMVSGLAEIDLETGKVLRTTVAGPTAASLSWPRGEMSQAEIKTWWANLPKVVKPMLPSEILRPLIRNVNDLGHPEGLWALVDAMILADLARDDLAGTRIGNSMINEYPLVTVYPMGHTKETTTNQGKTNLARILVNTLALGVPVTHAGKTPSAPSQRAAASPIEEFGTALYDEFQLPESHEHFLAQAGLQTLSTGGISSPGRAGENGRGASLKHPLFFTVKVSAFPPDIRNRSIPIFMDVLTDATRCSSDELAMIMSGVVSNNVRLSALMWIRKNEFVKRASEASLIQGKLRFDGHMTLSSLLTSSGKLDEVNNYLIAAEAQCNLQQTAADESGLSDSVGLNSKFDGVWYFRNCSEYTLNQIADQCENDQVMCLHVMRVVIEDAGARRFADIVRQFGGKERSLNLSFSDAIKEGRMVRPDGWYMEWVRKMGNKVLNGKTDKPDDVNRSRDCVVVRNKKAMEKTVPQSVTK